MKVEVLVQEGRDGWGWTIMFDGTPVAETHRTARFATDGKARRDAERFLKIVWRMDGFPEFHRLANEQSPGETE